MPISLSDKPCLQHPGDAAPVSVYATLLRQALSSEFIGFEASGLDIARDTSRKISTAVLCDRDNNYEAKEEHNWTAWPNG